MSARRNRVRIGAAGLFFIAFFAHACSQEPAANHRVQADVSRDDLAHFIHVLSSDEMGGRESGTAGGRKAGDFIARQFKEYKLHPAFGGDFFQEFEFKAGLEAPPEKNYAIWQPRSGKKVRVSHLPMPFARSSSPRGELVFAGFCLRTPKRDWDDLTRLKLKGKIALCLRHGPGGKSNEKFTPYISFSYKYKQLKSKGVRGVIFMSREGADPIRPNAFRFRGRKGPPAIFVEPDAFISRLKSLGKTEGDMLKSKKITAGSSKGRIVPGTSLGKIALHTDYRPRKKKGRNVGAYLRKLRPGQRIIILGAHYDHIGKGDFASIRGRGKTHNGADDNASGTSVILEVAGALRAAPPDRSLSKNTNVLFLAMDAEERGLNGSRYFVSGRHFRKRDTAVMINLDMVGRLRKSKGLHVQGTDTADPRLKSIVAGAFKKTPFANGIKLKYVSGGSGPSDHSSFYGKGSPVLFLHTGSHSNYHTSDDDFDTVNLGGVLNVTRMCLRMIRETAELKSPLVFRKAPKKGPSRRGSRYRVRLGIMPAGYDSDGKGVEVGSVREDAPVARAGLKSGDRIIELGGKKIQDIDDLMEFLTAANTRTEYKLIYRRGEKKVETRTRLLPAN